MGVWLQRWQERTVARLRIVHQMNLQDNAERYNGEQTGSGMPIVGGGQTTSASAWGEMG